MTSLSGGDYVGRQMPRRDDEFSVSIGGLLFELVGEHSKANLYWVDHCSISYTILAVLVVLLCAIYSNSLFHD